jgi:integrase
VKVRVEEWIVAADLFEGQIFRPVNKADRVVGDAIADEKAIWHVVLKYAHATSLGKLSPHDLRRTCAKLCRKAGGKLGARGETASTSSPHPARGRNECDAR